MIILYCIGLFFAGAFAASLFFFLYAWLRLEKDFKKLEQKDKPVVPSGFEEDHGGQS